MNDRPGFSFDVPRTLRLLDRADQVPDDKRYSDWQNESQREARSAVREYVSGVTPLVEVHVGEYGIAIMESYWQVCLRDGWEPVYAGLWMDMREKHWGLTRAKYLALPRVERARLEANEQLERWIAAQFAEHWLETYYPEVDNRYRWGDGIPPEDSWYAKCADDIAPAQVRLAAELHEAAKSL